MNFINSITNKNNPFLTGLRSGAPIAFGYFPAAMAFGLIARSIGLLFWEAVFFSMTNFAGASQFIAINLIGAGAIASEIAAGVLIVNMRYLLMSTSLAPRVTAEKLSIRALIAFGNTDEVFSVASLNPEEKLSTKYMIGLEGMSWAGWVFGTGTGYIIGTVLPQDLQQCAGITLYGMFTALLTQEIKKEHMLFIIVFIAALLNSICILYFNFPTGWSFIIAMLGASLFGMLLPLQPKEIKNQMESSI